MGGKEECERLGEEKKEKKKKKQGALVCKPDTLAVTVNKLTERKTVREGEVRREGRNQRGKESKRDKE